jgi:hypothetical protein
MKKVQITDSHEQHKIAVLHWHLYSIPMDLSQICFGSHHSTAMMRSCCCAHMLMQQQHAAMAKKALINHQCEREHEHDICIEHLSAG